MTLYLEMVDEDFGLLECLYSQLKWEGLATKRDIHRVMWAAVELGNLDQALIETASDIGRLNFFKSNPEMELDEIIKRIDEYDAILLKRSQQARQF